MISISSNSAQKRQTLRKLLKPIAATAPILWTPPLVSSVVLPAHAMTSPREISVSEIFLLPDTWTDTRSCTVGINRGATVGYEVGLFFSSSPDRFLYLDAITFANSDVLLLQPVTGSFPIRFGRQVDGSWDESFLLQVGEVADCDTASPLPGVPFDPLRIPILHFRNLPPTPANEFGLSAID